MPSKSPCQDCPHRKLTCHDKCDEYLEFHDALVEARKSLRKAQSAIDFLIEASRKRAKKAKVKK